MNFQHAWYLVLRFLRSCKTTLTLMSQQATISRDSGGNKAMEEYKSISQNKTETRTNNQGCSSSSSENIDCIQKILSDISNEERHDCRNDQNHLRQLVCKMLTFEILESSATRKQGSYNLPLNEGV
jgi:hypothetical protein